MEEMARKNKAQGELPSAPLMGKVLLQVIVPRKQSGS
jgi:hypothetical protein